MTYEGVMGKEDCEVAMRERVVTKTRETRTEVAIMKKSMGVSKTWTIHK